MNWIRKEKRLAIYLRDGFACCYCGASVEDGVTLTLDHLTPYSAGGSNKARNLVTCCHRCNSSRGKRSWRKFAGAVARYLDHDVTVEAIAAHIKRTRQRVLHVDAARGIIAARGSFAESVRALHAAGGSR